MKTTLLLSVLLPLALASPVRAAERPRAADTRVATHPGTGVTIVAGTLELPAHTWWWAPAALKGGALAEVHLAYDDDFVPSATGRRSAILLDRKAIEDRRRELNSLWYECRRHAQEHDGLGPVELPSSENSAQGVHLEPGRRLLRINDEGLSVSIQDDAPLLTDLSPAIDDGQHWVVGIDGSTRRVAIDPARMKELGVEVKARRASHLDSIGDEAKSVEVPILARLAGDPAPVRFSLRAPATDETLEVEWDPRGGTEADAALCSRWARQRAHALTSWLGAGAALNRAWVSAIASQYQLDDLAPLLGSGPGEARNATDVMGMLGGRAAIRETLQLRGLRASGEDGSADERRIDLDEIAGVEVESHPFAEMLGGQEGGRMPLADWIPRDRFLLYLPQPRRLPGLLDGGADFLFEAGSGITERSLSHGLKARYLDELGLSETLLNRFLETGAIEEMVVSVPDLHLIDGTEISVVMKAGRPILTTAALGLVGVPPGDGRTVKEAPSGGSVYWERRGSIVILSTSESELDAMLAAEREGSGLGRSEELRYMLTQVPVSGNTLAYAYFSDPFIRHLVGPRAKIGQMRRLMARAELEDAAAGALLASLDGHGGQARDLAFLRDGGYVPPAGLAGDLVLRDDGTASSPRFGSPSRMRSLAELPLERASGAERDAYEQYRDAYSRYWRRFFDPIAIRYDAEGGGSHSLETFILPLVDNSLYQGLRQVLVTGEETGLPAPVVEPEPIARLSLNLDDEAWLGLAEEVGEIFESVLGLDAALLDLLGPDVHVAIQDADPILTIGNGEIGGLFGTLGGDGAEMLGFGILGSVLTRPCTIHVGLEDPAEARRRLAGMTWTDLGEGDPFRFGTGSLYRIRGQDRWIYTYDIEGLVTLRFGLEIQDRYLVINNQPFSNRIRVTGSEPATYGAAALVLNPARCLEQRPALLASALEQRARSAYAGAASLAPLCLLEDGPAAAAVRHRRLFGFAPVHPQGGSWRWDEFHGVESSRYGVMWSPLQPDPGSDEVAGGLLRMVEQVEISMRFEHDGLRSRVQWRVESP